MPARSRTSPGATPVTTPRIPPGALMGPTATSDPGVSASAPAKGNGAVNTAPQPTAATPGAGRAGPSSYTAHPGWTLVSLALSLVGTAGVAAILYAIRFGPNGAFDYSAVGIPVRDLFVVALALVGAPFLVSIFYRVHWLFFLLPIVLNGILYPLFAPYGFPATRDPIFVYQFAQSLLQYGHWIPGSLVTSQAVTYSYWPAAGIYNAEFSVFTQIPLVTVFDWAQPIFRLLVVPVAVYGISLRFFGPRSAGLGVFLYLAVPSIELNIPTQQDFAVGWLALTLLFLACLATEKRGQDVGLRIGLILFSSMVVIAHHLSSYITLGWLAGLAILPYLLWGSREGRKASPSVRPFAVFLRYLAVIVFFAILVSAPGIHQNLTVLLSNINALLTSTGPTGRARTVGQTFPPYQLGWIFACMGLVALFALLILRKTLRVPRYKFLVTNLIIGIVGAALALVFLPTGLSILSLRVMEYVGLILMPGAAWFIVSVIATYRRKATAPPAPSRTRRLRIRWAPIGAVACALVIFTGGALVSLTTRDAFAPSNATTIDAPRYIDENAYATAVWASSHLDRSKLVWGDRLAYSVLGGLANLPIRWDSFKVFNGTNLTDTNWSGLQRGQYIAVDDLMTRVTPSFFGPSRDQPLGPLPPAALAKFEAPTYFQVLYQNSVFTIYQVVRVP